MTYFRGATEAERLANAYDDGFAFGMRKGAEDMRERAAGYLNKLFLKSTVPSTKRILELATRDIRALPIDPVISKMETTERKENEVPGE